MRRSRGRPCPSQPKFRYCPFSKPPPSQKTVLQSVSSSLSRMKLPASGSSYGGVQRITVNSSVERSPKISRMGPHTLE